MKFTAEEFLRSYISWQSMMQRCVYRGPRRDSKFYRDRGIVVVERWKNFVLFIEDMGPRPEGTTLDRIDNEKGYEPGNCRWATPREQAANTRRARLLEYLGEKLPIAEWARRLGIERATIQARLKRGMTVEDSLRIDDVPHPSFGTGLVRGKKLSGDQVNEIVALAREGMTATALGVRFGVTGSAICSILKQFGVVLKKGRPKR